MNISYKPIINIKKVESLNDILGFIKRHPNDIEEYSQERRLSCYICSKYRANWVMVYDDKGDGYVSVCWHCVKKHNIPIQKS